MQKPKSEEELLRELRDSIFPEDEEKESAGDVGQKAAERALDAYEKTRQKTLRSSRKNAA